MEQSGQVSAATPTSEAPAQNSIPAEPVQNTAPDAPAQNATPAVSSSSNVRIENLLEECVRTKASDLHLQVGLPPILRIDGALQPIAGYSALDESQIESLIYATLEEDQKQILIKDKEFDYSFSFGDLGRFRVNAFHEKGNLAGAFRLIPNSIQTIDQLGMPSRFGDWSNWFW